MKVARVLVALATLVATSTSCGDEPVEASLAGPAANRCTSDGECAAVPNAVCDVQQRVCRASVLPPDVLYVISFPTVSPFAGYTVSVTRSQLATCRPLARFCSGLGACFCLPTTRGVAALGEETYSVSASAAKAVGMPALQSIQDVGGLTVPVRSVFRPLSPLVTSSVLASTAHLPLLTIEGQAVELRGPLPTPGLRNAVGFRANLPAGRYVATLEPEPPFDAYIPPVSNVIEVGQTSPGVSLNAVTQHAFTLNSFQELSGWSLYMRDRFTKRRVSTLFRPVYGVNDVKLFTVGYSNLSTTPVDMVLEPPFDRVAVPSLVSPLDIIVLDETMPTLLPPVRVSGSVIDVDGRPVRAMLRFQSVVQDEVSLLEPINAKLRYARDVPTNGDGGFVAELPPGSYDVAIVPEPDTGYATRVVRRDLRTSGSGQGLSVGRLGTITGKVRLPGGAPLSGATVRAVPALEAGRTGPFPDLSRARSARTTSDGSFTLDVDPGIYDVSVIPSDGLRWPTTRIGGVEAPAPRTTEQPEPVALGTIDLGAPYDLGFSLFSDESRGVAVSGAFVRVYAIPAGRTLPVEIASGRTGTGGRVDLFASLPR